MNRLHAHIAVVATVSLAVGLFVACSEQEGGCRIDSDCGPGSFCRGNICAVLGSDAGMAADGQVIPSCMSPGAACASDGECCAGTCSQFRCTGGVGSSGRPPGSSGTSGTSGTSSGTTSSGGGCTDIYGLCASDFECCPGLSCTTGTCR